jgi:hypothetical protein
VLVALTVQLPEAFGVNELAIDVLFPAGSVTVWTMGAPLPGAAEIETDVAEGSVPLAVTVKVDADPTVPVVGPVSV